MEVFWLEQRQQDVPSPTDWLSAGELGRLACMRVPKRRQDWLLGRWTAKQAVAAFLGSPCDPAALASIEILPAESGSPQAYLATKSAPVSISLSHRNGRAACAVAGSGVGIGCDLEVVEPRCDAFVSDYFTPQEQELVARVSPANRFRLLALLWSAKESALKKLRTGLRIDTRSVAVNLARNVAQVDRVLSLDARSCTKSWHPLRTIYSTEVYVGWWQRSGGMIRTLVTVPASLPPYFLTPTADGGRHLAKISDD